MISTSYCDDSDNEYEICEEKELPLDESDVDWILAIPNKRSSSKDEENTKKKKNEIQMSVKKDIVENSDFNGGLNCGINEEEIENEDPGEENHEEIQEEFNYRAFIILKSDFYNCTDPPIWKITGDSLLQKYVSFLLDGKTMYKNTSVYLCWTIDKKDLYYPAPVIYKQQTEKVHVVELLKDLIQHVAFDYEEENRFSEKILKTDSDNEEPIIKIRTEITNICDELSKKSENASEQAQLFLLTELKKITTRMKLWRDIQNICQDYLKESRSLNKDQLIHLKSILQEGLLNYKTIKCMNSLR